MTDILEKINYIPNSQVHSNRDILNHKGKSLVYWLINCNKSIFFGKISFLAGVLSYFLLCMLQIFFSWLFVFYGIHLFILNFYLFIYFCLFRAAATAYGSSQARG